MVNIEGVYTRTEEKDYDKFLSALGVGFLLRKAATSSTPTMTISKSGTLWFQLEDMFKPISTPNAMFQSNEMPQGFKKCTVKYKVLGTIQLKDMTPKSVLL